MKSKRSKYGNTKVEFQGLKFDSKGELQRYLFLLDCQERGLISDLQRQVRIPLIADDQLVCHYIADFEYRRGGEVITEDYKGVLTDSFRIKAKLFKAFYLRDIKIIKKENITTL